MRTNPCRASEEWDLLRVSTNLTGSEALTSTVDCLLTRITAKVSGTIGLFGLAAVETLDGRSKERQD